MNGNTGTDKDFRLNRTKRLPDMMPLVLSYTNIVSEVSEFVKLKKVGRNYAGLCPFHSEKTPSFYVNESKALYYCFGCGKGGNVVGFLKDMRGESFVEVIQYLKQKYSIPLEDTRYYKLSKSRTDEEPLKKIFHLSLDFYYENLFVHSSQNSHHIIKYLQERGIDENRAKEFKLGFAGFGNKLTRLLSDNKVDLALAVSSGLLVKKTGADNSYFDRFTSKLIIPIFDRNDEPIAFASRSVSPDSRGPKYINTNNSGIFVKSNTLYGLNKSVSFIKKENAAIVVEGYFDMIMLYSKGIKNVVATMGTALSKNHIINLSRLCDEIILLYDGDEAGINAINRGIELFQDFMDSPDKNIYAVALSGEDDPDSFIRKYGSDKLISFINDNKKPPLDFSLDYHIDKLLQCKDIKNKGDLIESNENNDILNSEDGVGKLKKKIAVLRNVAPFLKNINNNIIISHYMNLVSNRLGLKEDVVRGYIFSGKVPALSAYPVNTRINPESLNETLSIEELVVARLFFNPLLTDYINNDIITDFTDSDAVYIIKEIKNRRAGLKDGSGLDSGVIEDIISNTENKSKWSDIYYSVSFAFASQNEAVDSEYENKDIKRLIVKLKVDNINRDCERLLHEIKNDKLDEGVRLLKFKELNKLKYLSKEFQKKICSV